MTAPGSAAVGPCRRGPAAAVRSLARTLLGGLVVLLLGGVVLGGAGWRAAVVTSGSMAPAVQPGDVALVRPVDAADLEPGQVLLVDAPSGGLLLHRLVAVTGAGLQLRGDVNPEADGSLVPLTAVQGVGTVLVPAVGLPVLWSSQGRWLPLAGTGLVLAGLVGAALLHRDLPVPGSHRPAPDRRRSPVRTTLRGAVAALVVAVLVPTTAAAAFRATTANGTNAFSSARWYSCGSVAVGTGASAHYGFQDVTGGVAANRGSTGSAADGAFSGGVTAVTTGPPKCGQNGTRAVSFNGTSGVMSTSYAVSNPQTFTLQLWFATTTNRGGKLIGFGDSTGAAASFAHDRHVYMNDTGQLVLGIYDEALDSTQTTTTPGGYRDGAWHLMTATFSAGTGLRLYVDGVLRAVTTDVTSAERVTGQWRVGFDTIDDDWPTRPTSQYFQGSIAHVSVWNTRVLSATEVAEQYQVGS